MRIERQTELNFRTIDIQTIYESCVNTIAQYRQHDTLNKLILDKHMIISQAFYYSVTGTGHIRFNTTICFISNYRGTNLVKVRPQMKKLTLLK